jgi:hypothetical protein
MGATQSAGAVDCVGKNCRPFLPLFCYDIVNRDYVLPAPPLELARTINIKHVCVVTY